MIKERKTFITKLYIVKFDCFLYKNYILVFETIQYLRNLGYLFHWIHFVFI